jgi:hypothetical protein
VIALLLVLAALAGRKDIPPAAETWAARLEKAYAHYSGQEFRYGAEGQPWPLCPRPGADGSIRSARDPILSQRYQADPAAFTRGCEALQVRGWELWIGLHPTDQRLFSPVQLRVSPLPAGRSGLELLQKAVGEGALASRNAHAVVPVGGWLVELHSPCTSSLLLYDEVADLLAAVSPAMGPEPAMVALSPCGQEHFTLHTPAHVREQAARPREYFGLPFPDARYQVRGLPVPGEPLFE